MQHITLFEIPIYSMSKCDFQIHWNRLKQKYISLFVSSHHTVDDAKLHFNHL
ncbi:MAG: hypothetical protein R3Y24_06710 [Eubacteriales bacterium]